MLPKNLGQSHICQNTYNFRIFFCGIRIFFSLRATTMQGVCGLLCGKPPHQGEQNLYTPGRDFHWQLSLNIFEYFLHLHSSNILNYIYILF